MKKPTVSKQDVENVIELLELAKTWMSSFTILVLSHKPYTENNKRWLRAVAEASNGKIASGPGTPGYILTKYLTQADVRRLFGLKSQGQEMLARHRAIIRAFEKK